MNESALESRARELLRQTAANLTAPDDTMTRVRTRAVRHERRRTAIATSALATAALLAFVSFSPGPRGATAAPTPTPSRTLHLGAAACGDPNALTGPWWFKAVLEAGCDRADPPRP